MVQNSHCPIWEVLGSYGKKNAETGRFGRVILENGFFCYLWNNKAAIMQDTFDHKSNIDELIRSACDFQADLIRARAKTNEVYRQKEPVKHNSFRITLDGLIVRTSQVLSKKIENTNEKISYQISLVISFVRTHFIINDMIMEGDLIEAFTLIRKNFESLTRLHEIDSNPILKLLKKTPNVINLFKEGGKKLYPTLSEIAHFGTPAVGELLTITSNEDGRVGPSIVPVYNQDAIACYDRHAYVSIYFIFWLIQFLKNVYKDQYDSAKDERTFLSLMRMAEESGIIQLKPEESGKGNHAASS